MTLDPLIDAGFDKSYRSIDDPKYIRVQCSQCEAVVVNGVPCHEIGCPNHRTRTHEAEEV